METSALENTEEHQNELEFISRTEQILDEMLIYDFDNNEGDSKHGPMSVREVLDMCE